MQNKDSWFHPLETFVQIEGKEIKVFGASISKEKGKGNWNFFVSFLWKHFSKLKRGEIEVSVPLCGEEYRTYYLLLRYQF